MLVNGNLIPNPDMENTEDKIRNKKVPKIDDKEYVHLSDFPPAFLDEVKKVAK